MSTRVCEVNPLRFLLFLRAVDNSGCACGLYWLVRVSWSIIVGLYLLFVGYVLL